MKNLLVEVLEEFAEAQGRHRATLDVLPSCEGGDTSRGKSFRERQKARGLCVHCRTPARMRRDGRPGTECERQLPRDPAPRVRADGAGAMIADERNTGDARDHE